MAITTLNGVIAGFRPPQHFAKAVTATLVAGRPASLWSLGGNPGAGAFDTTLNGVTLSSSSTIPNGALRHWDPSSGNAYLSQLEASATQSGMLLLLDRVWHNGGYTITSTSGQNSTTPTWPSRCPTSGIDDTPATTGLGIESVMLTRGANPVDGLATFAVYRSLNAKNNGKKEKYRNTFPFNYATAGGNVYSQAQVAMKALPWAPGLVDA